MTFWEFFGTYVGVAGVIALILVSVYAYLNAANIIVQPGFENLMLLVLGFYFGKNGTNVVAKIMGGDPGAN